VGEILAENNTGDFGFDDAERPAVFDGRFGLRVPGFLMSQPARQDDLDGALGFAFGAGVVSVTDRTELADARKKSARLRPMPPKTPT
jgi:hypothetical protein